MVLYEINKAVEVLKLNKDKNKKQCSEVNNEKTDEKEISFGEVLHNVMNSHK